MKQRTKIRKIEVNYNSRKRFEYLTLALPLITQDTNVEKLQGPDLFKIRRYSKVKLIQLQLYSHEKAIEKAEFLLNTLNFNELKIPKRRHQSIAPLAKKLEKLEIQSLHYL